MWKMAFYRLFDRTYKRVLKDLSRLDPLKDVRTFQINNDYFKAY